MGLAIPQAVALPLRMEPMTAAILIFLEAAGEVLVTPLWEVRDDCRVHPIVLYSTHGHCLEDMADTDEQREARAQAAWQAFVDLGEEMEAAEARGEKFNLNGKST